MLMRKSLLFLTARKKYLAFQRLKANQSWHSERSKSAYYLVKAVQSMSKAGLSLGWRTWTRWAERQRKKQDASVRITRLLEKSATVRVSKSWRLWQLFTYQVRDMLLKRRERVKWALNRMTEGNVSKAFWLWKNELERWEGVKWKVKAGVREVGKILKARDGKVAKRAWQRLFRFASQKSRFSATVMRLFRAIERKESRDLTRAWRKWRDVVIALKLRCNKEEIKKLKVKSLLTKAFGMKKMSGFNAFALQVRLSKDTERQEIMKREILARWERARTTRKVAKAWEMWKGWLKSKVGRSAAVAVRCCCCCSEAASITEAFSAYSHILALKYF